jgi:hypothetical protein
MACYTYIVLTRWFTSVQGSTRAEKGLGVALSRKGFSSRREGSVGHRTNSPNSGQSGRGTDAGLTGRLQSTGPGSESDPKGLVSEHAAARPACRPGPHDPAGRTPLAWRSAARSQSRGWSSGGTYDGLGPATRRGWRPTGPRARGLGGAGTGGGTGADPACAARRASLSSVMAYT